MSKSSARLSETRSAYNSGDTSGQCHEPEESLDTAVSPSGRRTQRSAYDDERGREDKTCLPAHPIAEQAYADLPDDLPWYTRSV